MDLLELDQVGKSYGSVAAVNEVSFSVRQGSIFGLLGPNGAGKTSTIRMITGITVPDRGQIRLLGEPLDSKHQELMGYMPEERGLYKKLGVRAQLEYLGALKGLDKQTLKKSVDYWLDRFGIRGWESKKTSELSKGMHQKLQFVATVLHDPEILILDEPLTGLDPVNAQVINEVIMELRSNGKSIILSTHRMEQVEQLCDDIALMHQGRVVLEGSLRDIKRGSNRLMVTFSFFGSEGVLDLLDPDSTRVVERGRNTAVLELLPGADSSRILQMVAEQVEVRRWEIIEPSLTELFLEAVGEGSTSTKEVVR